MLLLHLVELAFGQLFFNHTWLGVCVLVWAFPCGLMLLLHLVFVCTCLVLPLWSGVSLAFVIVGVSPALF